MSAVVLTAAAPREARAPRAPVLYPAWFLVTPRGPGVTGVGVAPRYETMSTSIEEATAQAHHAVLLALSSHIQVDMLVETVGSAREYRGENYQEKPLADSASTKIVDLDTAVVGDLVMVLSGTAAPSVIDRSRLPMAPVAPDWVSQPPKSDGALTVTGSSTVYYYEQNSWIEAEARARRAAAFEFYAKAKGLLRASNGADADVAGAISMSTDAILDHAEVVQRWRDKNLAWVLLRVGSARLGGKN